MVFSNTFQYKKESGEQDKECSLPFPKRQIFDSPKLKEFADDNFKFDRNGKKFSERVDNT